MTQSEGCMPTEEEAKPPPISMNISSVPGGFSTRTMHDADVVFSPPTQASSMDVPQDVVSESVAEGAVSQPHHDNKRSVAMNISNALSELDGTVRGVPDVLLAPLRLPDNAVLSMCTTPTGCMPPPVPLSPLSISSIHRQIHDTYKVITSSSSPKKIPPSEPHIVSPQHSKRPHLNLNLTAVKTPAGMRTLVPSASGRVKKSDTGHCRAGLSPKHSHVVRVWHTLGRESPLFPRSRWARPRNSDVRCRRRRSFLWRGGACQGRTRSSSIFLLSFGTDSHYLLEKVLARGRYRMTTKYPAASATVRLWEANMNERGVLNSRTFLSSGKGYPVAISSVIKVRPSFIALLVPFHAVRRQ